MGIRPVALITGASRGIGAETARQFAAAGYEVALVATSTATLEALASEIRNHENRAVAIAGDLSDLEFIETVADRTIHSLGRVDVLVNNAASRELVTMQGISAASWNQTINVCLTAPAFLSREVAQHMQPGGVIVNISSIMSQQAMGISPAYAAAKGGLEALTIELASLYAPRGIRALALRVGAVDTEMSSNLSDLEDASRQLRTYTEDMIMLGRWATPQEIARTIRWLASEDASYVTGTTITIDGGWRGQHVPHSLRKALYPNDFA